MLPTHRTRIAICAIALVVVLLMAPNLLWLAFSLAAPNWVPAFILPLLLLAIWFAAFGDLPWLACLLLAPFAAMAPLESFYIIRYHHPTSAEVIATLVATNPRETREYLGSLLIPILLCIAGGLFVALAAAWLSRHQKWKWSSRPRVWLLTIAIVAPLAALAAAGAHSQGGIRARTFAGISMLEGLSGVVAQGYPFGVIQRTADYRSQWLQLRANVAKLASFRFHAHRSSNPHRRQVYVLVIGESSRRDQWQLFGYDKQTNPELSKLKNLVPLRRMLTSWPESLGAIPLIVTRKPITSSSQAWKEASIIRAMSEAGFDTYWISNQLAIGKFDSPVSTYAYQARHVEWLNHASWAAPGSYDGDLLQPLRDALADSNNDLFIVLHMMGSHSSYNFRYPPSFARWNLPPRSTDGVAQVNIRIRDSYDNTILYTDHVLARIIDVLRKNKAITALWFLSDHGETLPTATCDRIGHGVGSRYDFQVPALFWYSDAYVQTYPARVSSLRAHADARTLSADTFESLIDMAGVTFQGHNETWSLFSQKWRYRPRIVNSMWQTNYDEAAFGKGCEIVLPPNP